MLIKQGLKKYFQQLLATRLHSAHRKRRSLPIRLYQLTLSLLVTLISTLLCYIQPVEAAPSPQPLTCGLGVYLLSLQDFNMAEGSFGADFWVWINCPTKNSKALELIDFVNAKEINGSLDNSDVKANIYMATRKIHGVFKHDWDVANFPFDRHAITIEIENGQLDRSYLIYQPESLDSGYLKNLQPKEWSITSFSVRENIKVYNTTYGDPTLSAKEGSKYSNIAISIGLKRNSFIGFLKLTTAVYIAVAITLAVYFINPSRFEPRIGTLVGALFAIVVNQQVVDSTLGQTEGLKLVDQIHMIAMAYVLAAVIVAIISLKEYEQGKEKAAIRRDCRSFYISAISFIIANIILIGRAAIAG